MDRYIDLIWNLWNLGVVVLGLIISFIMYLRYKKTGARSLLNCLPGIWTSLGLLGTFLSICLSLHGFRADPIMVVDNVGKVFSEANTAGASNFNLNDIIQKLVPAFTTSIVGLIGALFCTVWAKWVFANEDHKVNNKLGNSSPEEFLQQIAQNTQKLTSQYDVIVGQRLIMEELVTLLKSQQEKNREYNDRLNDNIGHQSAILKEFIDGFVNRMDDIFQKMQVAIQHQVDTFGEEQFTKTSELITAITEKLRKISTDLIEKQQSSVDVILKSTNQEIQSLTQNLAATLNQVTSEVKGSFTELQQAQSEKLNAIIANYDSMASKLAEQNASFAEKMTVQMEQEYVLLKQQHVDGIQQMSELRTSYQSATSDMMKDTLQTMGNMMQSTQGQLGDISDKTIEALAVVTSEMQGSLTKLESEQSLKLNQMVTNFTNLATRLSEQNVSFAERLAANLQEDYARVEQHNVASLQQMIDIRDAFHNASLDMTNSALDMNKEVTTHLQNSIGQFVSDLEKSLSDNCSSLANSISQNVEALDKSYRFVQSLVAEIRQNYDQAVLAYGDAVNVAHRTNETSERSIKAMAQGLTSVEDTNRLIGELMQQLMARQDNLERLTKQISSISGAVIALQKLESTLNKIANA